MFKKKIAYLVCLMEQIKVYSIKDLEEILEFEDLERILDNPQISDRDWNKELPKYRRRFMLFLDIHISILENVNKRLENLELCNQSTNSL